MQGRRYRVKAGDSLSGIAQAQLGRAKWWPRIYAYNTRPEVAAATGTRLTDPDKLSIGQQLLMPPPHLVQGRVSHAPDRRHPRQSTTPRVAGQTRPAEPGHPSPAPAPAPVQGQPGGAGTPSTGTTTVNSFPFKYKLDLIPKQTVEGPNYTATISFDGTLTIWLDKQIPLATLTNKGAELSARRETDGVFAKLVQSQKISWEPGSRKATYENMLTTNAHGAPPSLAAVGFAVSTDNPIPAIRFKFFAPTL